jgi:hypothetical protein
MSITNTLKVTFLSLCLGLIGFSGYLIVSPQVVEASNCSATCPIAGGGSFSVSCSGSSCTATDGVGCFAQDMSRGCNGSNWDRPKGELLEEILN